MSDWRTVITQEAVSSMTPPPGYPTYRPRKRRRHSASVDNHPLERTTYTAGGYPLRRTRVR